MALEEYTIRYKTYVKTALVQALRGVFENHTDPLLNGTHVVVDYPRKQAEYPAVIVRFFERDIRNMGIGHEEHIQVDGADGKPLDPTGGVYRFRHFLYHGDIEYAIMGLSSKDRDLLSDSIIHILAVGKLEAYTNRFFDRIYPDERKANYPDSIWHFINIQSDEIKGQGETQVATPWQSEDDLVYQTGYRTAVMGEFYSVPPDLPKDYISNVLLFPYIGGLEDIPEGNSGDDALWEPAYGG